MSLVTASRLAKTYLAGNLDAPVLRRGSAEVFLHIGDVFKIEVATIKGTFDVVRCANCGEAVFVNKGRVGARGETLCTPSAGCGE